MGEPTISGLRDRVAIEHKIGDEYRPAGTLRARVTSLNRLPFDGETMTHRVVLRFRSDVTAEDRIIHRGRTLRVLATEDVTGRKMFLACRCAALPTTPQGTPE